MVPSLPRTIALHEIASWVGDVSSCRILLRFHKSPFNYRCARWTPFVVKMKRQYHRRFERLFVTPYKIGADIADKWYTSCFQNLRAWMRYSPIPFLLNNALRLSMVTRANCLRCFSAISKMNVRYFILVNSLTGHQCAAKLILFHRKIFVRRHWYVLNSA
jgi:hypothetical protein